MESPILQMEELVERLHGGQKRQDGTSNAMHVRRVRVVLVSAFLQAQEFPPALEVLECAALGHDLLEDTPVDPHELEVLIGSEALGYIRELTNTEGDAHTEGYVAQMVNASEEARLIKYADLVDNQLHASYQTAGLGIEWMRSYFLPIVDPMREALSVTTFTRYPRTAELLRAAAAIARTHLAESIRATEVK